MSLVKGIQSTNVEELGLIKIYKFYVMAVLYCFLIDYNCSDEMF